ncbi:MAG: family 16 glycosylhydrolase [Marmoricola sp.]
MMRTHHASIPRRLVVLGGVAACVLTGALAAPTSGTDALPGGAAGTTAAYDISSFDADRLSDKLAKPTIVVSAPHQAAVGAPASADVSVAGAQAPGEIVVLETPVGPDWVPVTSARLDDHSRTTLEFTPGADASAFRVRISATTRHQAATSDVFAVAVTDSSSTPTPSPAGDPAPTDSTTPVDTPTAAPTPSESPSASDTPTTAAPATSDVPAPSLPAFSSQEPAGEPSAAATPPPQLCGGDAPVRTDGRPWVCTYDDEFDGTSLDRRYWVPQQSKGSEFYTGTASDPACALDDPRTIDVHDGMLNLNAVVLDDPVSCGSKSSRMAGGSVMTHGTFSQTYGRFEVRAKLPDWAGNGYQETFWLWPNNQFRYGNEWPSSGEIDFAEFYSSYPALTIPVMHYVLDVSTIDYATNTNIYTAYNCTIRPGEFNTYGLEWYPGLMKILVNGQVCITNNYRASNAPANHPNAPFDSPFFLALSQAFGAEGNELDVATAPKVAGTVVDYMRVWE